MLNLVVSGLFSAILALLFDLEKLVEFMSIGTLLAYTIVSASVIILRYKPPPVPEFGSYAPDTPDDDDEVSSQSSIDTASPTSDLIEVALAGRLKSQFRWLEPILGKYEPGSAVAIAVFLYTALAFCLSFHMEVSREILYEGTWWPLCLYGFLIFCIVACVMVITVHNQNTRGLNFKVPLVPFLPALSIFCNIVLMVHLSALTWIRFFIWVVIGMLVYFLYGIHHSKEGEVCSSYSMLLSSSEATKCHWGTTTDPTDGRMTSAHKAFQRLIGKKIAEDKKPIFQDEEP